MKQKLKINETKIKNKKINEQVQTCTQSNEFKINVKYNAMYGEYSTIFFQLFNNHCQGVTTRYW